jgi:hypothetical protein
VTHARLLMAGAALALLAGCDDFVPDMTKPGPLMRPGWNCLATGCHFPDGRAPPPDWGAGGTVFPSFDADPRDGVAGVSVLLVDARGVEVRLLTNSAGNFYTPEPLEGPIDVTLQKNGRTIKMPTPAPAGSCNFCHAYPPIPEGPPGRIHAP